MAVMVSNQTATELEQTYVHSVYSSIAPFFDHSRNGPWPKVLEFLGQFPCGSLIGDVGCGNGKYSDVTWNNTFMCGMDICPELLAIANREGSHQGVVLAENTALPFVPNKFDGIISIGVIHHLSTEKRRIKALRECAKLLRPGGKLLVNVWALEQVQRHFSAQDVLVPWKKQLSLRHSAAISTGSVDSVDGLPSSMHEHGEPMDCGNAGNNSKQARDQNKEFYSHFFKDLSIDKSSDNSSSLTSPKSRPPAASPSMLRRFQSWWKSSPPPEGISACGENDVTSDDHDPDLQNSESNTDDKVETGKSTVSSSPAKSPEGSPSQPTTPVPEVIADVHLPPYPNPMLERKPYRRLSLFTQKITSYSPRFKRRISLWLNPNPEEEMMKQFAGKLVDDCYRSVMLALASIFSKTIPSPLEPVEGNVANDQNAKLTATTAAPMDPLQELLTPVESPPGIPKMILSPEPFCAFTPVESSLTPDSDVVLNRNASDSAVCQMIKNQPDESLGNTGKYNSSSSSVNLRPHFDPLGDKSVSLPNTPVLKHMTKPPFMESARSASLKQMTWHRYYHVFKSGELERLISRIEELQIVDSHFDHANWCVVAVKKERTT